MQIGVYGSGYLGTVISACLADFGTPVSCCHPDRTRMVEMAQGNIPFFEKNLKEIIRRNVRAGRLSYSTDYPITQNWWTITDGNCSRAAELIVANGEPTHVPANVTTGTTRITVPVLGGRSGPWRIDPVVCKTTISGVPLHTISP